MQTRLAECFLTVFPDLDINSVASASAGSLPSWDSVATVTLLAVVEEEFGINVDTSDLASFDSFESILGFIRESRPGRTTDSYDEDVAVLKSPAAPEKEVGSTKMKTLVKASTTDSNPLTQERVTSYGYSNPVHESAADEEGKMSNSREEVMEDPLSGFGRLASKLHTLWLSWTYPFASIGKKISVHYSCDLPRSRAKYIRLGNRVTLGREVWVNIPNVEICNEAAIILEDGCGIGRRSVISAKNQIHIQRNTIFGPSVLVMDHNHAFEDVTRPIAQQPMTPGGPFASKKAVGSVLERRSFAAGVNS